MEKKLSRKEAEKLIEDYFSNKNLDKEKTRKIKRLAMKHNIKLKKYRKRFCKKCYSDTGKVKSRINNGYKTTECVECGFKSRWKIK